MAKQDDDFLKRLLETFRTEAEEHLIALANGLISLEQSQDAAKASRVVETMFREIHSLKGAARSVNLLDVETLCQSMESVMAAMKRNELAPRRESLDVLHAAVNGINGIISGAEGAGADAVDITRSLAGLLEAKSSSPASVSPIAQRTAAFSAETIAFTDTVRVPTKRLETLLRKAEELLPIRVASIQRSVELRELRTELGGWSKRLAELRPLVRAARRKHERDRARSMGDSERNRGVESIMDSVEWNETLLASIQRRADLLSRSAETERRSLQACVEGLLEGTRQTLMLPFSYLTEILPKTTRELSRVEGKEVDLVLEGTNIEVDRLILQELKEPMIHLLRNSVDHGIETPENRRECGKPARGIVTIAVQRRNGSEIDIEISDDGAGIDPGKVKDSAVRQGIVSSEEAAAMTERDALSLIYRSGTSTSPIVTDISGRGIGLAIVRDRVEGLGGSVSVQTDVGRGTRFHLVLPLTRATFRGLLVRCVGRSFVVPSGNVERASLVMLSDVRTVANRKTISIDGKAISFASLQEILGLSRPRSADVSAKRVFAAIISAGGQRLALAVDEVVGEQEVLVKGLGPQLQRVINVAGAAILGTGEVVPVLNVADLLTSAAKSAGSAPRSAESSSAEPKKRKSILVVEDSITARALIKNILDSAGFDVTTAVDGAEGFATARERRFDLVVSDVDMPRMSGFELTAKIRADKRLCDLPIVLVTALESRQDRERGIDVGANAYIVKSSFEQSNLLEVINRFV